MNRWTVLFVAMLIAAFAMLSCSGGDGSPVAPTADQGITDNATRTGQSQTHLWGYYDVTMDLENGTVEAVPNRSAMFAANVVQFLNGNPMAMQFNIHSTVVNPDSIDVDITVGLTHPLPGMTQYNGYDVRGIFVADGSGSLNYGSGLRYAVETTDQFCSNPDGYTRWFNASEFRTPGLMGYTPGDLATQGYTPTGTLNPYKYYANGLAPTGDVWDFLTGTTGDGVFASGSTNQRRYELNFPNTKGVRYGYAVVANWKGEDPADHPANAPEAVGLNVTVTDNVWYVDNENWGGDLILDIDVFNWDDQPQPSRLYVDSDIIGGDYEFTDPEMVPTGGGANVSTYHVEIPVTELGGTEGNEYWVIAEYEGHNYMSDFTPPGGAPSATLAAFFRYDLFVATEP